MSEQYVDIKSDVWDRDGEIRQYYRIPSKITAVGIAKNLLAEMYSFAGERFIHQIEYIVKNCPCHFCFLEHMADYGFKSELSAKFIFEQYNGKLSWETYKTTSLKLEEEYNEEFAIKVADMIKNAFDGVEVKGSNNRVATYDETLFGYRGHTKESVLALIRARCNERDIQLISWPEARAHIGSAMLGGLKH